MNSIIFLFITFILSFINTHSFITNVPRYNSACITRMSYPVVGTGFADPNWNWGSSVGKGHEAAMKLRLKLGNSDSRAGFIKKIVQGSEEFNLEDIKLALALRFQRASYEGIEGSKEGSQIMNRMAKREYEGGKGEIKLRRDLDELLLSLPADMVSGAGPVPVNGEVLEYVAAKVLMGMNFVTRGI
mmetsp:Transcript_27272/g.26084  ORF Transcript_27272/g.26084 Transcript_27272/m.26084 type:complete len:186 (+) Transcript_27272:133-690(+)